MNLIRSHKNKINLQWIYNLFTFFTWAVHPTPLPPFRGKSESGCMKYQKAQLFWDVVNYEVLPLLYSLFSQSVYYSKIQCSLSGCEWWPMGWGLKGRCLVVLMRRYNKAEYSDPIIHVLISAHKKHPFWALSCMLAYRRGGGHSLSLRVDGGLKPFDFLKIWYHLLLDNANCHTSISTTGIERPCFIYWMVIYIEESRPIGL